MSTICQIQDGDSVGDTTAWTPKPMTSDAADYVRTEKSLVPEEVDSRSKLPETTPGKTSESKKDSKICMVF